MKDIDVQKIKPDDIKELLVDIAGRVAIVCNYNNENALFLLGAEKGTKFMKSLPSNSVKNMHYFDTTRKLEQYIKRYHKN